MRIPNRWTTSALAFVWLGLVGALTLTSAPDQAARVSETPWSCLACGDAGLTDVILNVLLFLPLGLLARAAGWTVGRTVLTLLLLTVGIELAQANLLTGRDASLGDVLANSSGGCIGWLLLPVLLRSAQPDRNFATRAAAGLLVLSGLLWLLGGRGIAVAFSADAPWVGQPLHLWPGHDQFRGSLQHATINGTSIPNDPLLAIPERLDSLDLVIDVTRSDTLVSQRPISILRIVDAHQQLQLSLTQRHGDLLLEYRAAASRWLLRTPVWRFENAATIPANVAWRWRWIRRADRVVLQSGPQAGPATESQIPLSATLGWAFVHPFAPAIGALAARWTLLWIGGWLGLLGWFSGWVGRGAVLTFGAAGIATMAAAAAVTGLPVHPRELFLAALLFSLAALAATVQRRRSRRIPEA